MICTRALGDAKLQLQRSSHKQHRLVEAFESPYEPRTLGPVGNPTIRARVFQLESPVEDGLFILRHI